MIFLLGIGAGGFLDVSILVVSSLLGLVFRAAMLKDWIRPGFLQLLALGFAGITPVFADDQTGDARKVNMRGHQFVADPIGNFRVLSNLFGAVAELADKLVKSLNHQWLRV